MMLRVTSIVIVLLLMPLAAHSSLRASGRHPADASLDAFNAAYLRACQTMDQSATRGFWADDGVDLIAGLDPMVGKPAIVKWLDGIAEQSHGARMESCSIDWRDRQVQGDLAYEWGITRQRVAFPSPQPTAASAGKIVLILKRTPVGPWKVELESWNGLPRTS